MTDMLIYLVADSAWSLHFFTILTRKICPVSHQNWGWEDQFITIEMTLMYTVSTPNYIWPWTVMLSEEILR